MAQGNKLYPLSMAFYLRGDDLNDLRTNTNRLMAADEDYDPITGIPRMGAIPVAIAALAG